MKIRLVNGILILFINLHAMENNPSIVLCNLTPLKQTFEQYNEQRQLVASYDLKQFEVQLVPNVERMFIKHSKTENNPSPMTIENNLQNNLMKIKPSYGNLILLIGSNHFSSQTSCIEQYLNIDTQVNNNYVADIQQRGAVSILEDIMNPNNRAARAWGKYAPLTLLKSENLGNRSRYHSWYYCNNERWLMILGYLFSWLPRSLHVYCPSIDLSVQFHQTMDAVINKFKKREEEREKLLGQLPQSLM